MISIFFYYIIYQLIFSLFFKRDTSVFLCGISSFAPKKGLSQEQRELALTKIKILGLYNESRGTHGCGVLINGEVHKGWDDWKGPEATKIDTKLFKNFLPENYGIEYKGGVIITHSRQATAGSHEKENNHPFTVESVDEDPAKTMYLAHNGKIDDMYKLCNSNGVSYTAWQVDSHGLAMIMQKVGYKVLEEYEGMAALVWTYAGEPDTLYVYHGKYCELKSEEEKDAVEERPMYFLNTEEGIYFSSMANSLWAIARRDERVLTLEYNTVFQIKNGKFTKNQHKVNRLYGPNSKERKVTTYNRTYNNQGGTYSGDYRDYWMEQNAVNNSAYQRNANTSRLPITTNSTVQHSIIPISSKILLEALPIQARRININEKYVYFWKGRYHVEGGIPAQGIIWLTGKGALGLATATNTKDYYFWKGIMLKGPNEYRALMDLVKFPRSIVNDTELNFAQQLSKYSYYPITNLGDETLSLLPSIRFAFYQDEKRVSLVKFTPKFSSRNYQINRHGYLEDISTSNPKEDKRLFIIMQKTIEYENAYDKVHLTLTDALESFTESQFMAVKYFCWDYMKRETGRTLDIDNEELEMEVLDCLRGAIAKSVSLRVEIEDKGNRMEFYEQVENRYLFPVRFNTFSDQLKIEKIEELEEVVEQQNLIQSGTEIVEEEVVGNDDQDIDPDKSVDLDAPDTDAIEKSIIEDKVTDMIVSLGELNTDTDELSVVLNSPYAQKISDLMYKTLDTLKHKIAEIASEEEDITAVDLVNRTLNSAVV